MYFIPRKFNEADSDVAIIKAINKDKLDWEVKSKIISFDITLIIKVNK